MPMDSQNTLSDDQTLVITVAGSPVASTNYIDLGADRDIGKGEPVPFLAQITDAFTSGGAATLQLLLETDDNSSFSSAETLWDSGAIPKATLVAGYKFPLNFIPRTNQRYLRCTLTVGTADGTGGTIFIAVGAPDQTNLANV